LDVNFSDPLWVASQIFAFFALILSIWAWQVKDKIRMMLLVGLFSLFLAISASFLENYSLGVLFGLAAIRNFVFCYLDWRVSKGKKVYSWLPYFFAGIFITSTVTATALLWHTGMALWLEVLICVTLIGLIIGNIRKGTDLMRVSFIANRGFNIINHVYFNNAVAVVIAVAAIGSNVVFYTRQLMAWLSSRKENPVPASE
jgi:hypothetical protein